MRHLRQENKLLEERLCDLEAEVGGMEAGRNALRDNLRRLIYLIRELRTAAERAEKVL